MRGRGLLALLVTVVRACCVSMEKARFKAKNASGEVSARLLCGWGRIQRAWCPQQVCVSPRPPAPTELAFRVRSYGVTDAVWCARER
jgi:hypothetical protein